MGDVDFVSVEIGEDSSFANDDAGSSRTPTASIGEVTITSLTEGLPTPG